MRCIAGVAATAIVLVGCAPSPPLPAASVQAPPVGRGYLDSAASAGSTGALPLMAWPKFQASLATRANEAELAIILRGHELRERHPSASPSELAEMLVRDRVWEQHARFVESARRTVVIREALTPW
jgi:hypothetical protein